MCGRGGLPPTRELSFPGAQSGAHSQGLDPAPPGGLPGKAVDPGPGGRTAPPTTSQPPSQSCELPPTKAQPGKMGAWAPAGQPHLPPAHGQESGPSGAGTGDSCVVGVHHLVGDGAQPLRLWERHPGSRPEVRGRPAGGASRPSLRRARVPRPTQGLLRKLRGPAHPRGTAQHPPRAPAPSHTSEKPPLFRGSTNTGFSASSFPAESWVCDETQARGRPARGQRWCVWPRRPYCAPQPRTHPPELQAPLQDGVGREEDQEPVGDHAGDVACRPRLRQQEGLTGAAGRGPPWGWGARREEPGAPRALT